LFLEEPEEIVSNEKAKKRCPLASSTPTKNLEVYQSTYPWLDSPEMPSDYDSDGFPVMETPAAVIKKLAQERVGDILLSDARKRDKKLRKDTIEHVENLGQNASKKREIFTKTQDKDAFNVELAALLPEALRNTEDDNIIASISVVEITLLTIDEQAVLFENNKNSVFHSAREVKEYKNNKPFYERAFGAYALTQPAVISRLAIYSHE
jgi:hypothetical protein